MHDTQPTPIANYHCQVGENPLWNDHDDCLYWTDIPTGRLFRYDPAREIHEQIYTGEVVGGFTFQKDNSLLLFGANRIMQWQALPDTAPRTLVQDIDPDMERFNDVIADPQGRVFAGTIGRTKTSGGLYRIDRDGTVTCLFKQTGVANGMAFTPDRQHFYWTDSPGKTIYRFRYDEATGALSEREVFVQVPEGEGVPDGMTLDENGVVYSARWGGNGVFMYSPAGVCLGKLDIPVEQTSSCIFGGQTLCDLYVTTAGGRADKPDAPNGTLYRIPTHTRGLPEFRSQIACM